MKRLPAVALLRHEALRRDGSAPGRADLCARREPAAALALLLGVQPGEIAGRVRRAARHPILEAPRQFGGEPHLDPRVELVLAGQELVEQPELVVGELGGAGFDRLRRRSRLSGAQGPLGGVIPHDDRARRQVAETLVAALQEHHEQAGQEGEERQVAVDKAYEVSHHGGRGRDRVAGLHHHADAQRLLPGRATAVQRLEESKIAEESEERE